MGWSGGSYIFDRVVRVVLSSSVNRSDSKAIIDCLLDALEDADWDNVCESDFIDHPIVKEIVLKHHPDYYDE